MNTPRPRLGFISPVFLFPNDSGGKIRTTNILRGLKGGHFEIVLTGPGAKADLARWSNEITAVCDEFVPWGPSTIRPNWLRAVDLASVLPVNVANDKTSAGLATVRQLAARNDIDLLVFDFVHAAVLRPRSVSQPSVCFTHNVEAEILGRHAKQVRNPLSRWMWNSQYAKMQRFERDALRQFTTVIAVSDRDSKFFADAYGVPRVRAIPTGVDLEYFSWTLPPPNTEATPPTAVFIGSMNWRPNIDGIWYFLDKVWPLVLADSPAARFVVVGRDAPTDLIAHAAKLPGVELTGFVDDVRPYVRRAHVSVIPLLVGGGTRIKAFEAMAMGCPVVSTTIGIEGLDVLAGRHYVRGDDPVSFANAILRLFSDSQARTEISTAARQIVETQFDHTVASRAFEKICVEACSESN